MSTFDDFLTKLNQDSSSVPCSVMLWSVACKKKDWVLGSLIDETAFSEGRLSTPDKAVHSHEKHLHPILRTDDAEAIGLYRKLMVEHPVSNRALILVDHAGVAEILRFKENLCRSIQAGGQCG
jgi:hypothetical protein